MRYDCIGRMSDTEMIYREKPIIGPVISYYDIPAWSLHRLIEMMPSVIYRKGRLDYYLNVNRDGVIYDRMGIACIEYIYDNLFDNIILCIEWLIKEGYFNKEYLV